MPRPKCIHVLSSVKCTRLCKRVANVVDYKKTLSNNHILWPAKGRLLWPAKPLNNSFGESVGQYCICDKRYNINLIDMMPYTILAVLLPFNSAKLSKLKHIWNNYMTT